ncbi:hypothetical protein GCM10011361_16350 [Muriicola marianensis]|uniref:DUF1573 domain-containing protein n=1 Tax=Muriicola marianensis TaxID=1324801 RepID=A0ABQ1QWY9_9FLAO|nr:hypothetical protein GCM10011361_16350 [Muriicola marianensis]
MLILEDLSVLFEKKDDMTASKGDCGFGMDNVQGFPVNGCGTFTLKQTIKYFFGESTIETKVTVCCSCAVCFPMRFGDKEIRTDPQKGKILGIKVVGSSSISYKNYEISIAEGDYAADEFGNIKKLKYKVIIH